MATIVFAAAGAALGSGFGGSVLGLSGAVIGRSIGATLGRTVDQRLLGNGSEAVEVGKLDRLNIMGASEGTPIARCWGRVRLPGHVIWASPFRESSQRSGGKGAPSPKTVSYSYHVSLAISLCEGEILGIGRIWADGVEISPQSLNIRTYKGSEDQLPDPIIEAYVGAESAPAYRGTAYVVIEDLELATYGNRVPQLSFEVMRRAQRMTQDSTPDLQDAIRAVALIPGTGEYALSTTKVVSSPEFGDSRVLNCNSQSGDSDFSTSIKQLQTELPNCSAVSLVVSWFGNDLRCGECEVQPKIESYSTGSVSLDWRAGGISRQAAREVPRVDGRSVYGGTPSDASVIDAINALRELDFSVMFYPFILMDQLSGNTLSDPYSAKNTQPIMPWRGRITLSEAPGRSFTPDQTSDANGEVSRFFGACKASDFSVLSGALCYNGPHEWSYRRFILHYAHLCKLAGGVESFCIGSEMRGLTQIRGEEHSFPAVQALVQLASDVRGILGPSVKISYAADWSEYFGYHVGDNTYFHLDPLWASTCIDFIGIDNYMPLSDWRWDDGHADEDWKSIYNLTYLIGNVLGGEGFDWYYECPDSFDEQRRSPISEIGNGDDWVYRFKDLKSWWSRIHYDRIGGVQREAPSNWIPGSKPIRFTEYGCAAINAGTNEPNKFLDFKSSESSAPRASSGARDDVCQMQFYRAVECFWASTSNNPYSELYDGPMVDVNHSYAWAWDVRPYPEFPRNAHLWSDSQGFFRGHWLNGRASSVPLDLVVREICLKAGVSQIDTTDLYGAVVGFIDSNSHSARSILQSLSIIYGFDCFERGGDLIFCSHVARPVVDLGLEDILLNSELESSLEVVGLAEDEAVSRVRLSYLMADGDFSIGVAEVSNPNTKSQNVHDAEFPVVLPVENAKGAAKLLLAQIMAAQEQVVFDLPISRANSLHGSVIRIGGVTYRVDRCDLGSFASVTATRTEMHVIGDGHADIDLNEWKPYIAAAPISRLWLDLPVLTADQNPVSPFLAVLSKPWVEPAALWTSLFDNDYALSATFPRASSVGETQSDFLAHAPGILDETSSLIVHMYSGELESISMDQLLAGRNTVAIGGGASDQWEVFQFLTAVLIVPGTYRISNFLRGQAGTDALVNETWPAGSKIVVVNDALSQVPLPPELLGRDIHYRLVPASQDIFSDIAQKGTFSPKGIGLRPYSVCHFFCDCVGGSTHAFSWTRRTRVLGDSWEGMDVPLGEDREQYLFRILTEDRTVLYQTLSERPFFNLSLSDRAEIGLTGPYIADVSQISQAFGPGPSKTIRVN